MSEQQEALAKLKAVYDDGFAEINGTKYEFTKMTHNQRRKVFAFFSGVQNQVTVGDFSFLDRPDWQAVENVICDNVLVDGMQVSKRPAHWDNHAGDYIIFITTALGVVSYPFLQGSVGS